MPERNKKNNKFSDGRGTGNGRRVSASRTGNVDRHKAVERGWKDDDCLASCKDCKEIDNADNEESTGTKGRKNTQQLTGHWK